MAYKHTAVEWKKLSETLTDEEWKSEYEKIYADSGFTKEKFKSLLFGPLNSRYQRCFEEIDSGGDKDAIILEIGCLSGCFIRHLRENGYMNSFGMDIIREAVKVGNEHMPNSIIIGALGNYNKHEIPDSFYDYVCCLETLEHVRDYKSATREMLSMLRQKGKILLTVPYQNRINSPYHLHSFDTNWMDFAKGVAEVYVEVHGDWMFTRLTKL